MAVPPLDLTPNAIVTAFGRETPEVVPAARVIAARRGLPPAAFTPAQSPDSCSFTGYLGGAFRARKEDWCVLYLDLEFRTWLLIQERGILNRRRSQIEPGTPASLDVLWVKADTAVCSGNEALSLEGLFLIGNFARAGDFDVESLGGGTQAAGGGGYGLAGQSPPRCCTKTNRRP
jgi:hypothetical protein